MHVNPHTPHIKLSKSTVKINMLTIKEKVLTSKPFVLVFDKCTGMKFYINHLKLYVNKDVAAFE